MIDIKTYSLQRFWSMFKRDDPKKCWIWQGGVEDTGYPSYGARNSEWGGLGHRLSFLLAGGEFTNEKDQCCHTCDVVLCVNPHHLFAGSRSDNSKDMINKGRHASQLKTHCSRGHEYTEDNTYNPPGKPTWRMCIQCRKDRDIEAKIRRGVRVGIGKGNWK